MAALDLPGERGLQKSEWSDEVFSWVFGPYTGASFPNTTGGNFLLPFLHPKDIVIDDVRIMATTRPATATAGLALIKGVVDATTKVHTAPTATTCDSTTGVVTITNGKQVTTGRNIGTTTGITALRMEELSVLKGHGPAPATSFVGGVAPGDALRVAATAGVDQPWNNVVEAGNRLYLVTDINMTTTGSALAGLYICIRGRERKSY